MSTGSSQRIIRRYSTAIVSMLRQSSQHEIEEVLTMEAEYDSKGLLLREWKLQPGETSAEEHFYTYDNQGLLLKHHLTIPDDGIEESFLTLRNADGKPLEITKFYGDEEGEKTSYTYAENVEVGEVIALDADGEFEQKESFTCDEQKRMSSRRIEKVDGTVTLLEYQYNDQGLLSVVIEKEESGKQLSRQEHDYTVEGLEARIRQWNDTDKLVVEINSEYNEIGKLISKKSSGFLIRINRYDYDEAGNVIEESLSDENDFVISRSRYSYDADNQLIEETIYETDLTRSGRDTHYTNRYEYE